MSDQNDDDEYQVGYRKPPKATQFKKGQTGNPKGRSKAPNARTLLKSRLEERIEYVENGRRKSASKKEVLIGKVVAQALTGGIRERQQLLDLIVRHLPEEFQDEPNRSLAPEKADILQRLAGRLTGHTLGKPGGEVIPKPDDLAQSSEMSE